MATPFWLNAVLRSLVWLGATAFLANLKKPHGATLAVVRPDFIGWLGGGLLLAGTVLHIWSNVSLARGEHASHHGADGVVTHGPYRWTRNPIYLAGIPLLLGACLLHSTVSVTDFVAGLPLMAFFHFRVVRFEEPELRRRFGQSYEEYCHRVPRWIPRMGNRRLRAALEGLMYLAFFIAPLPFAWLGVNELLFYRAHPDWLQDRDAAPMVLPVLMAMKVMLPAQVLAVLLALYFLITGPRGARLGSSALVVAWVLIMALCSIVPPGPFNSFFRLYWDAVPWVALSVFPWVCAGLRLRRR